MTHHFTSTVRSRRSLVALAILVMSLSWCSIPSSRSGAANVPAPPTTSWPAWCPGSASDVYGFSANQSSDVTQSFNGSIKGCFRVPDDRSSTLNVAWQTFVQLSDSSNGPNPPTNGISNSYTDGHFKLTLSSTNVRPGEHVTVIGRYLSGHRPPNTESGILCWDGCQSGIQEQGQNLHWVSSTEFRTTFLVPDAPWYESNDGRATAHPLSSGTDTIGIECVTVTSGCATQGADAQIGVTLVAPKPTWCATAMTCGSLHVNSVRTTAGDVMEVHGKAPIAGIIAQPFGYWLEYSTKSLGNGVVSFHSPVSVETTASIAPRALSLTGGATWATQDLAPVSAPQWSWTYSVTPSARGTSFASCDPHAIVITGVGRTLTVPITSVGPVPVRHHLNINGSKTASACASALIDPAAPTHVFASFYSAQKEEIPPTYLAGLFTTDGGAVWKLVPTPSGHTSDDFGGFRTDGSRIEAVFMSNNINQGTSDLSKTTIVTEATSNGGDTWTQSTLGCPTSGPCVIFGPSSPGNCAMNGQPEPVYFGSANHTGSAVIFDQSRWVNAVNACYSQEMAATTSGTELLLDPSSIFPLVASHNGGRTWYNVQIPRLTGMGANFQNSSLLFDPEGSILATTSNNKGGISISLLAPHAHSWCPALVITTGYSESVSPLRTVGDQLYWSETDDNHSTLHIVPISSLHCT
jgi:hypothetical protein